MLLPWALGLMPNSVRTLYSGVILKFATSPLRRNFTRACTNGHVPVHCKL
jgi:hypothetical protein